MCSFSCRISTLLVATAGIVHLTALPAQSIELLVYCQQLQQAIDQAGSRGAEQLVSVGDFYAPQIEGAINSGNVDLAALKFQQAVTLLVVHYRNSYEQIEDLAQRASHKFIPPACRDDIYFRADLRVSDLDLAAMYGYGRIVAATGDTGIVLEDPDGGPNGPPATRP